MQMNCIAGLWAGRPSACWLSGKQADVLYGNQKATATIQQVPTQEIAHTMLIKSGQMLNFHLTSKSAQSRYTQRNLFCLNSGLTVPGAAHALEGPSQFLADDLQKENKEILF